MPAELAGHLLSGPGVAFASFSQPALSNTRAATPPSTSRRINVPRTPASPARERPEPNPDRDRTTVRQSRAPSHPGGLGRSGQAGPSWSGPPELVRARPSWSGPPELVGNVPTNLQELVAAGDGALSTCTCPGPRTMRKSSTSLPSGAMACARTPAPAGTRSAAVMAGTSRAGSPRTGTGTVTGGPPSGRTADAGGPAATGRGTLASVDDVAGLDPPHE